MTYSFCSNCSTPTVPSLGPASSIFGAAMTLLLTKMCEIATKDHWPPDHGDAFRSAEEPLEFDFIVVGAGSAGCALVNKLIEDTNYTVLLLEAGEDPPVESEMPLLFPTLLVDSPYNWGYLSEQPSDYCLSLKNSCKCPRGKMLGGTSGINTMMYVRGTQRDFNRWRFPEWSYERVLEVYKSFENPLFLDSYDTSRNPLSLSLFKTPVGIKPLIYNAASELGLQQLEPLPGPNRFTGFGDLPVTVEDGIRWSSAKAFLTPIKDKENLFVVRNARVTKVEVVEPRATSVIFRLDGQDYVARATKEIILSAGSINSPQIMLLSGIGPAKHLEEIGIPLVKDLPAVGRYMQDHIRVPYSFRCRSSCDIHEDPVTGFIQYLIQRTGSYASLGSYNTNIFVNTTNIEDPNPDIQCFYFKVCQNDSLVFDYLNIYGYDNETFSWVSQGVNGTDLYFIHVGLIHPKSRGFVELQDSNPFSDPKIVFNFLEDPSDLKTLIRGIRFNQKLFAHELFRCRKCQELPIRIEACMNFEYDSDAFWECYIRHMGISDFHQTSTTRMGDSETKSVVDSKLRVHGIQRLRVCDAGAMPRVTSGNTNAPSMMIGRMCGKFIVEEYN